MNELIICLLLRYDRLPISVIAHWTKHKIGMKQKVLMLCMLFIPGLSIYAHQFERDKTLSESFKILPETEISVSNKYGNINVKSWDRAEVKFDIKVVVKGTNVDRVNKIIRNIDAHFSSSDSIVHCQTVLSSDKNKIFADLSEFATKGSNIHIDINIFLPSGNKLTIYNKHGNIYLREHLGALNITLSHGSLKADKFLGNLILNLSSANASIIHLANAKVKCNDAFLNFRNVGISNIDSKYSKIKCDKARELILISKKDHFYLGNIEQIKGKTVSSYIQLDQLSKSLNLETKHGDLVVDKIVPSFKEFNLKSISTSVSIIFDEKSTYDIQLEYNRKSDIHYSDSLNNYKMEVSGANDDQYKITGTYGIGGHLDSFVKISQKSGNIEIVNK